MITLTKKHSSPVLSMKYVWFKKFICFLVLCLDFIITTNAQNLINYSQEKGYELLELSCDNQLFYKVVQNGMVGIMDVKGNIVVPIKFNRVQYKKGFFEVQNDNFKNGIYSLDGHIIVPCRYFFITKMRGYNKKYYFHVTEGPYKGVFSLDGKEIIPANKYTYVTDSPYGYKAHIGGHHGLVAFIDWDGKEIIPAKKYTSVFRYGKDLNVVVRDNRAGVCDDTGKELFFTRYTNLSLEQDKNGNMYFETRIGPAKGKMDINGKVLEEVRPYVSRQTFKEGDFEYVSVCDTLGNKGIEVNGHMIIPCKYDNVYYSGYNNWFTLIKNGTMGIASREGDIIIPTGRYHDISWNKKKKYYKVTYLDTEGICASDGKEIFKPGIYNTVDTWEDSLYYVKLGDFCGIVDNNYDIIVPIRYTKISKAISINKNAPKRLAIKLYDKEGICDLKGNEIIPPIYDNVNESIVKRSTDERLYNVKNGDKEGLIDANGKLLMPAEYFEKVFVSFRMNGEYYIYAKTGNRTCEYDFNGNLLRDSEKEDLWNEYYSNGDKKFKAQNYVHAMKEYKKAADIRKNASLSYNIALCLYNTEKYKESIKYLNECLSLSPSDWVREHAIDVKNKCIYYREQSKVQRCQNILSAINGIFNIGMFIYQMEQIQKKRNAHKECVFTGISGNDDYILDDSDSDDPDLDRENLTSSTTRKVCRTCKGDGKCLSCHGDGIRTDNQFGTGQDPRYKCGVCGGDGICNICKGTGRQ